ncbi:MULTISPECIES: DEAD/DEAH box helicase [unclassified Marinobacter]|uniref:DEAD/DEAH box helicase n=1 Tax=unclassified Marinobacter TaxID=83889 RepID=UPI0019262C4C|nr:MULTISPECIES: DEAD/DEAH box helicase [unclassified Marinobacter]MBL3824115.1 DEAD/DEAH box helicase [Marinobacter sp. MC3]MBL3892793.1 DEAD/DEAH box helicase [Marinobacter sp. MW3]
MLNPITYTEQVVSDFLRYQLSTYAFADDKLYQQMRELLNLEQTRSTPLLRGPYISLSRTFQQGATLEQLVKEGVLHPHIRQLSPYPSAYLHQEKAFRAIHAGKPTLVSTGTGSGKTEAFLMPIVSRCLQLRDEGAEAGVTAVIVYPMNALAEDQLQRMRELLAGTGVTFGMYVGKTPQQDSDVSGVRLPPGSSAKDYQNKLEEVRAKKQDIAVHPPEERVSREAMRTQGEQPRILLTNVKQLELLLTRQRDLELFDNARLEFMVFDEAHTFTGANGAETACLIRRLRSYCGKDENSTTCVATSATIADPVHGQEAGRVFASRFFGVDGNSVELVGETYEADIWGEPRTASGPLAGDQAVQLATLLEVLGRADSADATDADTQALRVWFQSVTGSRLAEGNWREALYQWLSHNEVVFQVAEALRKPQRLVDLLQTLSDTLDRPISEEEILIWLALGAASRNGSRPLLRPVVHGFVRGVGGAVVSFPEGSSDAKLWLSAEDALDDNPDMERFPISSCTTCGQHYYEHSLEDFNFTATAPGGGTAEGKAKVWRAVDQTLGGVRALSLDHQVGSEADEEPAKTETLFVCRYCGTTHDQQLSECISCGRDKVFKPLFFVQQKEDNPGKLTRCVSCGAHGRRFIGTYREPARPVRATTVSDVHVLAQSMIHRAERRRLLVFADNRQDAAFQAGWMQDRSRRYRLRELIYKRLREGETSVSDLTLWLDQFLDQDDELSRALIPEVWRVEPKSQTGVAHSEERKWFLRAQILRELTMGARQSTGLEPLGRLKVKYHGLDEDLPFVLKWSNRLGCKADDLVSGIASLIDNARSRRMIYDSITKIYSKFWLDGEKEVLRGYLPSMKGVPAALVFQRDGQHEKNRINQWYSNYGSVPQQAAQAWGVPADEVEDFLAGVWGLLLDDLEIFRSVQLKGARGKNLPGCHGSVQVNVDHLTLYPAKGMYRCQTCRRLHARPNPSNTCMGWRCNGRLDFEPENKDNYDLLLLDQEFAMLRAKEHSAQIPGPERERIENAFKGDNERINTLVCTPTLEMGVNIGALDAVLMRNVPPLPANYWQRAGRAGRQFRMALDLTYARATSHDRAYFNDPLKLLEGQVEPPSFNLRNPVMVAKHVHATVLTTLFKLVREGGLSADDHEELGTTLSNCLPTQIKSYLFNADNSVRSQPMSVEDLGKQIRKHRDAIMKAVTESFRQGWPYADMEVVEADKLADMVDGLESQLQQVVFRLYKRLKWALAQLDRLRKVAAEKGSLDADDEALRGRCERMVKRLKGDLRRFGSKAEGFDETNTYGVLAAEGFLPGYGLDSGAVTLTHVAPRYGSDISDWDIRRNSALAVREYVPGNLIYANGHKFVPRTFQLLPEEPLTFSVDLETESVVETGGSRRQEEAQPESMGATHIQGVSVCDVDAPHNSYISDDEEYRFQMPVAVFAQDQRRHSGGSAYEWGSTVLHHKHGMYMRLVNVGASGQVKSGGMIGYPICRVCGASRSPMSTETELQKFNEIHLERCGHPVEPLSFYAEVIADALVLPDCASKEVAYSLLESLRQGAAEVLDMEISDLQVQVIAKPDSDLVDGILYDPMPGGSGLLEQLLEHWSRIVAAARALVEDCPSACEASCVDCLQHFRNSFYHDSLNRHTALDYYRAQGEDLRFTHEIPPVLPDDTKAQDPGNAPEQQLVAMLKAAGLSDFETETPIKLSGGFDTRPDVYFHEPNDQFEGVCVYLDGMSQHIHGNTQTAAKDHQIREELRNTDYEVIEIQYQELFDKTAMRDHIRRIARAVVGKKKAKEIIATDEWFDNAASEMAGSASSTESTPPGLTIISANDPDFAPYESCVPLSSLKSAAGAFSDDQAGFATVGAASDEWVSISDRHLEEGMFVAQVVGDSMEPEIPNGSYCLFRPVPAGTRQNRKLLVWHSGVTDQETGGQYTLKVYSSEKVPAEDGDWVHHRITLKPLNPAYEPIVLEPDEEGQILAIAEFMEVLG